MLAAVASCSWRKWEYYLPPEQTARDYFVAHKADFVAFAILLKNSPSVHIVESDGRVLDGVNEHPNLGFRAFTKRLGIQHVIVREDGSMEFAIWGGEGAVTSGSYMGVRYCPKDHKIDLSPGWEQTIVTSLDSNNLPHENSSVATGLYVVTVEPEWFIYRLECQE